MRDRAQRRKANRDARRARKNMRSPGREGSDPFNLGAELVVVESRARQVFTPHQPISTQHFLFGRGQEVSRFISALGTPGQHALLYGERGVGKTSLATVVGTIFRATTSTPYFIKRCDKKDTFISIVREPLLAGGNNPSLEGIDHTQTMTTGRGLETSGLSVKSEQSQELSARYNLADIYTPSVVASLLGTTDGLLLIDEVDALDNNTDREKLAELIKLLSDGGSPFKVMIVGIAETAGELTAAHPSVRRCLSETKLGRMSDTELREIILTGERVIGIQFHPEVVSGIIHMSIGYPHFTHLLALKCAEIVIGAGRKFVDMSDLRAGIDLAIRDSESSLTTVYNDSIRSASTSMFKTIVVSAAKLGSVEFNASDLRRQVSLEIGGTVTQNGLNNYYQRLISSDHSKIFLRTTHGHYRFEDPRMASFVRMANGIMI